MWAAHYFLLYWQGAAGTPAPPAGTINAARFGIDEFGGDPNAQFLAIDRIRWATFGFGMGGAVYGFLVNVAGDTGMDAVSWSTDGDPITWSTGGDVVTIGTMGRA